MTSWMLDREIGESGATATNAETETNICGTVVISDLSEQTDGLLALRLPECPKNAQLVAQTRSKVLRMRRVNCYF